MLSDDLSSEYDSEFGNSSDMFSDLEISKTWMQEYHRKLPAESFGRKLHVSVLKQSGWPFSMVNKEVIDLPIFVCIPFSSLEGNTSSHVCAITGPGCN
jgi:hypothetical protein